MNKLLQSMSHRLHLASNNANEDRLKATPDTIKVEIKIDAQTWCFFENLDEDSRTMMAHVLKDYVERQK